LETRAELKQKVAEGAAALEKSRTNLRNQSRILKLIFDSMAEGVIVADPRGRCLLWNRAAEQFLGGAPRDIFPDEWPQVYGVYLPDRETPCPAGEFPLARAMRGESTAGCEFFLRNSAVPKGIWVSVNASPLQDHRGTPQGGVAVIRDITEQKVSRDVMARQRKELERSNRDLEQFAYVSSHDLQEPLRAVSGYCQLLQRRYAAALEPKAAEYIGEAVQGARRMQALIEGLLAYSRVGRHGHPIAPTSAQAAFNQALVNLHEAIAECSAEITHGPLPVVPADPLQLMQLFQNLIGNSLKYRGERRPQIHVAAELGCREWVFSVRDNGIGIDPRFRERIFVIFQRLHTRSEYPGTGIGLALCKRIVERHGGRIWVESEPGAGSTFFFSLPSVAGDTS
jgi:signal transduction histidine kinase